MDDNQIIRSPYYSDSRVVLKSGNDALEEPVEYAESISSEPKNVISTSFVDENIFQQKIDEYTRKLELIDKEQEVLLKKTKALEKSILEFNQEKEKYKEVLEKEVKELTIKKLEEEYSQKNKTLLNLLDEIVDCKSNEITDFEDDLLALAYQAVCKILGQTATDKEMVVAIVKEVISHAQDRMHMTLNVSPQDYDVIIAAKDKLSRGLSNRLNIVVDDQIQFGGCILKTDAGTIDGRLEQQLQSLLDLLLEERMRVKSGNSN